MMTVSIRTGTDTADLLERERLILDQLRDGERFTVEDILARIPELSWAQIFFAMDALSRRGDVELRRQGFSYTLRRVKSCPSGA